MVEKVKLSVLGCCLSRNIFNAPNVIEVFDVKRFGFQIVPWSCFGQGLGIPYEMIQKVVSAPFEQRILDYNLNKTTLQHFEQEKVDYMVIDLVACSFVMYEINYDGKKIYTRMGHGDAALNKMKNMDFFKEKGFSYRKLSYKDLDDSMVKKGLLQFVDWLKKNFSQEQIIICKSYFPQKYINSNLQVVEYSKKTLIKNNQDEKYINQLLDILINKLPKSKIYTYPSDMVAEDYGYSEGLPFHFTSMDYIRQGERILDLLKINYLDYYSRDIDPISYNVETWVKKYVDLRKMVIDLESKLLDINIKDVFDGTSISSVSAQPFGKGIIRVRDVVDRVKKQNEQ